MASREISIALALPGHFSTFFLDASLDFPKLTLTNYFESWSTKKSCDNALKCTSCNAGTGVIQGVSGNYAYCRTFFTGSNSAFESARISLSGRHLNLGCGEAAPRSKWTNDDTGNGTETPYKQTHSGFSKSTCARVSTQTNEKEDLRDTTQ